MLLRERGRMIAANSIGGSNVVYGSVDSRKDYSDHASASCPTPGPFSSIFQLLNDRWLRTYTELPRPPQPLNHP